MNDERFQDYPMDIINVGRLAFENFNDKYNLIEDNNDKCQFFKSFNPFDKLIIYPVLNYFDPFFHFLGYKSAVVGLISIIAFLVAIYYAYMNKKILVWIFIFFGIYVTLIDNIFESKCTNNKYVYTNADLISLLLKMMIFIICFIIIESPSLADNNRSNYCYIILFMLIVAIVSEYHIRNIIGNNLTNDEKNDLTKIRTTLIMVLIVIIIAILLLRFNNESINNFAYNTYNKFIK